MGAIRCGGALAGISLAGLALLCQCSLLYDLSGINAVGDIDAALDDGGGPEASGDGGGVDGTSGSGPDVIVPGIDASGADANGDGPADTGNGDSNGFRVDAADATANVDAADDTGGTGVETGAPDVAEAGPNETGADAAPETGGSMDATPDAGSLSIGLVAYYPFDESSGPTSADASGKGQTATMQGGATFAPGIKGNAASLNGATGYVSLPTGIISTLTSFSVCTWVNLTTSLAHNHIFDFGTGTMAYMSLSASSTATPVSLQFAITTAGFTAAQKINAPILTNGVWQHVCVTLAGTTGTIFVNGAQAAQSPGIATNPSALGSTTQNWLGRSQFPDPLMNGLIDNFRIYGRALAASEIQQLFQQQL